jgi:hypothetical protein
VPKLVAVAHGRYRLLVSRSRPGAAAVVLKEGLPVGMLLRQRLETAAAVRQQQKHR